MTRSMCVETPADCPDSGAIRSGSRNTCNTCEETECRGMYALSVWLYDKFGGCEEVTLLTSVDMCVELCR